MPLGPYDTFKECVTAQQRKKNPRTGKKHTKKSAQRICGHIEKQTKKSKK